MTVLFAPASLYLKLSASVPVAPASGLQTRFITQLQNGIHVSDLKAQHTDTASRQELHGYFMQLLRTGQVDLSWLVDDNLYCRVDVFSPLFDWQSPPADTPPQLSNMACIRRDNADGFVLESPETGCRLTHLSPIILQHLTPDTTARLSDTLWQILAACGFLQHPRPSGVWQYQEFHDRLFHHRSTIHRRGQSIGATYRFAQHDPYPPAKPEPPGNVRRIALPPAPDTTRSLSDILQTRRSVRQHADSPVSLDELGQLLALALKTEQVDPGQPEAATPADQIPRYHSPYPAAGGIRALRFYPVLRHCLDASPGFYRYDDRSHELIHLPGLSHRQHYEGLFSNAAHLWGNPQHLPQVLLLITCRLDLTGWKYENIAYRLSLLTTGCAMQTIYLAATQVGLACCALGAVNQILMDWLTGSGELDGILMAQLALGRPRQHDI